LASSFQEHLFFRQVNC